MGCQLSYQRRRYTKNQQLLFMFVNIGLIARSYCMYTLWRMQYSPSLEKEEMLVTLIKWSGYLALLDISWRGTKLPKSFDDILTCVVSILLHSATIVYYAKTQAPLIEEQIKKGLGQAKQDPVIQELGQLAMTQTIGMAITVASLVLQYYYKVDGFESGGCSKGGCYGGSVKEYEGGNAEEYEQEGGTNEEYEQEGGTNEEYEQEGGTNEEYEQEGGTNEEYEGGGNTEEYDQEGGTNEEYEQEGGTNEEYDQEGGTNEEYEQEGGEREEYEQEGGTNEEYEQEGGTNEDYEQQGGESEAFDDRIGGIKLEK